MLQRAAHHRAHQVAPVVGVRLMILQRIDGIGGGLGGGAEYFVTWRLTVERVFG